VLVLLLVPALACWPISGLRLVKEVGGDSSMVQAEGAGTTVGEGVGEGVGVAAGREVQVPSHCSRCFPSLLLAGELMVSVSWCILKGDLV
jgi:hypothetical protein